jgi:hypothetical protein
MGIAGYIRMPLMASVDARIRSSAIQVGLESTLSAGFPLDGNWNWRYSLENGWNALLKAVIWIWGKQRFKGSHARNYHFDEMEATRFMNGQAFAGGRADRIPTRA